MSELPPDLPRLQVIRTYLQQQLKAVDAAIAAAQQPAGWRIEHIRAAGDTTTGHGILHTLDCRVGSGPTVSREEAVIALTETAVMPCTRCKPEDGLGTAERPTS